jgi:ribosomal protein S18 acetylase RimI-like enzyme
VHTIRLAEESDRKAIIAISKDVAVFTREEVDTVDELFDEYLHDREARDYVFAVACDEKQRLLGFVCYGPTPLTDRTYDAYWLAVSKQVQGKGIGRALFVWMEEQLRAQGVRLIVLETSGTPEYSAARHMYDVLGYTGRLAVPDFYRPGDDLLYYVKPLQ